MATWNSRGLRGSTLEELINRTNEQYRERPSSRKFRHLSLRLKWIKPPGISRWHILNRKVP